MMNEELVVKIRLDTSGVKRQMADVAKDVNRSLGDATKGASGSTKAVNESMVELQGTMEQIKNLQFGELLSQNFDRIKDSVKGVTKETQKIGSWAKKAAEEFAGMFDFKNWDIDDPKDFWGSFKVAAKEAAVSTGNAFKAMGGAVTETFKVIGKALDSTIVKLGVVVAGIVGAIAGIRNALGTAAELKQMNAEAQKIGLSINAYQEWAYVLDQVGVSADKLSDFVKTLSEEQLAVREGSEDMIRAFNTLGLSADQVMNMSQDSLLRETIKRLQNIKNETERTSLAYQIFGEDAAELANVLRLTNDETASLASNMILLGNSISQGLIDKSTRLSSAVSNLRAAWQGLTRTLAELFMPIVTKVVEWLTKAIVVVNLFLKTVFNLDMTPAISNVGAAVGGIGSYTESVENATGAVEKLKRVTMGFDELNIVSNPNSSSGGGSGATGGGADMGGFGEFNTDESIFTKAQAQIEEFQEKVRAFMDEWKTELTIIAGALAALGVANLLDGLGKALGLGEKFHGVMQNVKKLAATAITITLTYSLVNEFMDKFIDGEGFKNYLKGLLVAALGTGVLYAMWGPAGLMIGLAVTAVASIKSVIDNGGITNIESATVAFTGLAAAAGAVATAIKIVDWSKLTALLAPVGKALAGIAGSIGAAFGATGAGAIAAGAAVIAAAIAAIAGVVIYLKENWDAVVEAFRNWFADNIAPKLLNIKDSFLAIRDSLVEVGKKIWEAIPQSWRDFLGDIAEAIGDVITKIGEWLASIDWLDAVGEAFEFIGGVIFNAVSGVILGALNTLVGIFESAAKGIEGAVDIISGLIELIIDLFTGDLDEARKSCEKILDGIVKLFTGLYGLVVEPVKNFVQGIIDWFVKLWDELVGHSIVPDMIDDIVTCFKEMPEKVFKWVKELVDGIIKRFTDMWNNVITGCKNKLAEARTAVMNGWNNIKSYFTTNIAPKFTLAYWQNKFDTMRAAIQQKLGEVRTQVMNSWNNIASYFNTNIAPKFTIDYWKNKLDSIRAAAAAKLGEAKTACINGWNHIVSWFNSSVSSKFTVSYWTNKWNTIKDGAKSAFNGVIAVVEKAVNGIIQKINTLSWKIPDWVPKYGGQKFGFNFKTISIPRLAEGGITVGSTLANIGENGREAVLPLDRNTQWMDQLADRLAARMNPQTKVVLKVNERELGYATINAINQNTKQTGGLQLQLV